VTTSKFDSLNETYTRIAEDLDQLREDYQLGGLTREERLAFLRGPLRLLDSLRHAADEMTALRQGDGWEARAAERDIDELRRIMRTLRSQLYEVRERLIRQEPK
jgi:hypothetical protein